MSRFFSTTARALVRFIAFKVEDLPQPYNNAVKKFTSRGGSAEQLQLSTPLTTSRSRNGYPVHQSSYNPEDKEFIISAKITGSKDTKTCHIYQDGTGTIKKGDDRC
ncbi:hypothetical protein MAC_07815 [Metarhizium acridum CQMa 102]|uniref:Uncharacterized protein n=1 Tax=Metarhizium acridum (strain CQMa 102) TaxID=655827 RepID=E9ED67_METAQ|nr:uncharacterized protein MAC_07815 [Metarhizium acridum CQMa 102]EFY86150.1 hypothetical protein MAC_07815 [Metarhizium acridum CQMa 102]